MAARSGACGFFLTLAASALAVSWAAISTSVGVAALTSGSVETNSYECGCLCLLIELNEVASVDPIRAAIARIDVNFIII
jgi:hypothetical protein